MREKIEAIRIHNGSCARERMSGGAIFAYTAS
jgi:hypothetical protein